MNDNPIDWCTFCRIVTKQEPAEILYEGRDTGLSDLDIAATIIPIEKRSGQ